MSDQATEKSVTPEEFEKNHRKVLKILIAAFVFTGVMIYPILSLQQPGRWATAAWILGVYQVNLAGVLIYWASFRKIPDANATGNSGETSAEVEFPSRFKE